LARAAADLKALTDRLAQSGDSSLTQDAKQQLATIQALGSQVATAGLLTLVSLRADVAATVASAGTVISQGQAVADQAAIAANLAHADAEARQSVAGFMDDYYKKKIFEPWLRFSSDEDRDAFREREAQRQAAIEHAQREGTPKGDLEAGRLALAQLEDAGAHGADRSPEYAKARAALVQRDATLAAAVGRSSPGTSTQPQNATADPFDTVAVASADRAALAGLKAAGVVVADHAQQGHGVSLSASVGGGVQRA